MTAAQPPSGIRLFATDLDGTLLLPDGTIGQRTREAIDALIERGIVVVFVTGRPPRWIRPIAEMTGHHGTAIGANGALVIDMEAEIIRRVHPIDPVSARATADRLRAVAPDITFAVEYATEGLGLDSSSFALSTGYVPRWEIPPGTEILEPDVLFARPGITKLLARPHGNHGHDADTLLDAADRAVADLVEVTHSSSDDVLLEMSALGVNKGTTLAEITRSLGIDSTEVVACGDMPNDIAMLTWAGHSYSMSEAHPAAQAAATAIIGSNAHEAVAGLIESILAT
ncbi:MAG: HAD-IIB family hydrolase [Actinobacteria bacterium]|jgi:hydroxymethylpyrimidine pyrophosphatase-like HAD family hydrolase|uniref:Unannotated protein n=2 Tax=freshwater metagenome TaxID=449393 RepID=A0A6J7IE82_9ZZZZ|nr:HAD-IIB family hydrolase [Actinomycetota bacterium]